VTTTTGPKNWRARLTIAPQARLVDNCLMPGRALAVSLLVALVAGGCGGGGGAGGGLPAAQILSRSVARTSGVKSFHVLITIENVPKPSGIGLTHLEGDLTAAGSLRAKVSVVRYEGERLSSEVIITGGALYFKDPSSGEWCKFSLGTKNPVASFFDPAKGVWAVIKGVTDVASDGSEEIGGTDSYRLHAKVRADALTALLKNALVGSPQGARLLPVELWIGKSDLLLRRIRLSGPLSSGEPKDAARTLELSTFGEPMRVKAPPGSSRPCG
jgi:lipoprotein LprG